MSKGKRRSAPAGLDYVPIVGMSSKMSFGVIRRELRLAGEPPIINTASGAIARRLFPVHRLTSLAPPWPEPTCTRIDVVLPPGTAHQLANPARLARAYDEAAFPELKDLVVITTIRTANRESLNDFWESVRGFVTKRIALDRRLASILALHVPGQAAAEGFPHVHIMAFARVLDAPAEFGVFARPFAADAGRALIEAEWQKWVRKRAKSCNPGDIAIATEHFAPPTALLNLAIEAYKSDHDALAFFLRPSSLLNYQVPADLLVTIEGVNLVRLRLEQLIAGVHI